LNGSVKEKRESTVLSYPYDQTTFSPLPSTYPRPLSPRPAGPVLLKGNRVERVSSTSLGIDRVFSGGDSDQTKSNRHTCFTVRTLEHERSAPRVHVSSQVLYVDRKTESRALVHYHFKTSSYPSTQSQSFVMMHKDSVDTNKRTRSGEVYVTKPVPLDVCECFVVGWCCEKVC
jgi:hypothetical protein